MVVVVAEVVDAVGGMMALAQERMARLLIA